jgi:chromosome segregation ATPase
MVEMTESQDNSCDMQCETLFKNTVKCVLPCCNKSLCLSCLAQLKEDSCPFCRANPPISWVNLGRTVTEKQLLKEAKELNKQVQTLETYMDAMQSDLDRLRSQRNKYREETVQLKYKAEQLIKESRQLRNTLSYKKTAFKEKKKRIAMNYIEEIEQLHQELDELRSNANSELAYRISTLEDENYELLEKLKSLEEAQIYKNQQLDIARELKKLQEEHEELQDHTTYLEELMEANKRDYELQPFVDSLEDIAYPAIYHNCEHHDDCDISGIDDIKEHATDLVSYVDALTNFVKENFNSEQDDMEELFVFVENITETCNDLKSDLKFMIPDIELSPDTTIPFVRTVKKRKINDL